MNMTNMYSNKKKGKSEMKEKIGNQSKLLFDNGTQNQLKTGYWQS